MYLGAFPHITAVLRILLDNGQDAGGDDAMRLAEIAVDLLQREGDRLLQLLQLFG